MKDLRPTQEELLNAMAVTGSSLEVPGDVLRDAEEIFERARDHGTRSNEGVRKMDNPFEEEQVNPLEAEIRRIVRDEIRKAFQALSEAAGKAQSWNYNESETGPLGQIESMANVVVSKLTQEEDA